MNTEERSSEELVRLVTRMVVRELQKAALRIPIGVSNRHIHLDRADMDVLFGQGSELTRMKDLGQPGQYACEETLTIQGPKGAFKNVRVLGPLRKETQVEISLTDARVLGIKAPVRESGILDKTPGVTLIGPRGTVQKSYGTIAALRHIHMTPEIAAQIGIEDKDIVRVELGGARGAVLDHVLVRVSNQYALEMHIDVDEANAVGAQNNDTAKIVG